MILANWKVGFVGQCGVVIDTPFREGEARSRGIGVSLPREGVIEREELILRRTPPYRSRLRVRLWSSRFEARPLRRSLVQCVGLWLHDVYNAPGDDRAGEGF